MALKIMMKSCISIFFGACFGLSGFAWQESAKVLATFKGGQITETMAQSWRHYVGGKIVDIQDQGFLEGFGLTLVWFEKAKAEGLLTDTSLKDQWASELAKYSKKHLKAYLFSETKITEAAIEKAIVSGKYAGRPEKVRLRQLYKKYPAGANDVQKKEVLTRVLLIKKRVEAGETFDQLAQLHSDSQSRFRGGLIGNVARGDLDPRIEVLIFGLDPGQTSEPFATKEGVMLFYCEKRILPIKRNVEQQRGLAEKYLKNKAFESRWRSYVEGVLAQVTILWDELGKTAPKTPLIKMEHKFFTREQIGARMNRAFGKDASWQALAKAEVQAVLEQFCVEKALVERFEGIRDANMPQWRDLQDWAYKKFWSLRVLDRDVKAVFVKPTDSEISDFFEVNRKKYRKKPAFELMMMQWILNQATIREKTQLAETVRQAVLTGKLSFEDAAQKHSEHISAAKGGAIGWVSRFQVAAMGRNVLKVIQNTKPGSFSELVRQDQSLFWFKVLAQKEGRLSTLAEVREKILKKLADKKLYQLQIEVENGWLEKVNFQMNKTH